MNMTEGEISYKKAVSMEKTSAYLTGTAILVGLASLTYDQPVQTVLATLLAVIGAKQTLTYRSTARELKRELGK